MLPVTEGRICVLVIRHAVHKLCFLGGEGKCVLSNHKVHNVKKLLLSNCVVLQTSFEIGFFLLRHLSE